jgi:hypothetical protein
LRAFLDKCAHSSKSFYIARRTLHVVSMSEIVSAVIAGTIVLLIGKSIDFWNKKKRL